MTRKDFEFFAAFCVENNVSEHAIGELIIYFTKKNPRFDAIKFNDKIRILKKNHVEAIGLEVEGLGGFHGE